MAKQSIIKEELGKDPNVLGAYIATSGVRAAKLGQYKKAQQYFRSAIAVSPLDWHHYFRLLLALLPPVGRKVWLRHYSNSS